VGEQLFTLDPDLLLDAIRKAEGAPSYGNIHLAAQYGGDHSRVPEQAGRKAAGDLVAKVYKDWQVQGKPGDFLDYLRDHYAPLGAGNDPHDLNANWLKNVMAHVEANVSFSGPARRSFLSGNTEAFTLHPTSDMEDPFSLAPKPELVRALHYLPPVPGSQQPHIPLKVMQTLQLVDRLFNQEHPNLGQKLGALLAFSGIPGDALEDIVIRASGKEDWSQFSWWEPAVDAVSKVIISGAEPPNAMYHAAPQTNTPQQSREAADRLLRTALGFAANWASFAAISKLKALGKLPKDLTITREEAAAGKLPPQPTEPPSPPPPDIPPERAIVPGRPNALALQADAPPPPRVPPETGQTPSQYWQDLWKQESRKVRYERGFKNPVISTVRWAARNASSQLARLRALGPDGEDLAGMIVRFRQGRNRATAAQMDAARSLDKFNLSEEEASQLGRALEGRLQQHEQLAGSALAVPGQGASTLSPNVQAWYNFAKPLLEEFLPRVAENAKLTFQRLRNYRPRIIDQTKLEAMIDRAGSGDPVAQQILQNMAEGLGFGRNNTAALIGRLRHWSRQGEEMWSFQHHREAVYIPESLLMRTDKAVLTHLNSVLTRVEKAKIFGVELEKLEASRQALRAKGTPESLINEMTVITEEAIGNRIPQHPGSLSMLDMANSFGMLDFSNPTWVIKHFGQILNSFRLVGHSAMGRSLLMLLRNDPEALNALRRMGAGLNLADLRGLYPYSADVEEGAKLAGRATGLTEKLAPFTTGGLTRLIRTYREWTSSGGRLWGTDLLKDLFAGKNIATAVREFKLAGYDIANELDSVIAEIRGKATSGEVGGAAPGAIQQHLLREARGMPAFEDIVHHPNMERILDDFGARISYDTFFGGGPMTRAGWMNSPLGRMGMFLHNYAYQQTSTIYNRMFKIIAAPGLSPVERAKEIGATATWLLEATAFGAAENYAIDAVKTVLHSVLHKQVWDYKEWEKERKKHPKDWRWALVDDAITGIGMAPIASTVKWIAQSRDPTAAIENELLGAVPSRVLAIGGAVIKAAQKKKVQILTRETIRQLAPFGTGSGYQPAKGLGLNIPSGPGGIGKP
jgi:hypothetical protein